MRFLNTGDNTGQCGKQWIIKVSATTKMALLRPRDLGALRHVLLYLIIYLFVLKMCSGITSAIVGQTGIFTPKTKGIVFMLKAAFYETQQGFAGSSFSIVDRDIKTSAQ